MKTTKVLSETVFPFFKPVVEKPTNALKQWILNRQFVKDAIREAEVQAFPKALADLKETNLYDTEERAKELMEQQMSDMLSNVDMRRVVTFDKKNGIIFIGGQRGEMGRLANLKSEAEFFMASDLWGIINESIKELSQKSMFINGETLVDMQKGKSILYTLSTQKNIVELFRSYAPRTPTAPPVKP